MLDRDACERRVYRLATLLTGSPMAATAVITDVVATRRDIRDVDSAHLDRLTVLRSREISPGRIVDQDLPETASAALADLSGQQREAWVFNRVYALPEREISRAMDCSTAATERHLQMADSIVARQGGDPGAVVDALRTYSLGLEVPAFYRVAIRRRQRMRLVLRIGIGLGTIAILLWIVRSFGPALIEMPPPDNPAP